MALGDEALRAFAPDEEPVLWPEHFDVGITVDEVNYGVSPGDGFHAEPYAYVGPWQVPAADDFWDAPFGAARALDSLGTAEAVQRFFEEGRAPARQRVSRSTPEAPSFRGRVRLWSLPLEACCSRGLSPSPCC